MLARAARSAVSLSQSAVALSQSAVALSTSAATSAAATASTAATTAATIGAATTFGVLSALRGARIFHPDGVAFDATVEIEPRGPAYGALLLDSAATYPAVVRLSRGAGVPEPAPDVLGLAVRVLNAYGDGADQDLLLATSGESPGLRHSLLPSPGFADRIFSSVLTYRVGGAHLLFGARATQYVPARTLAAATEAADRGRLSYELLVAPVVGPWRRFGTLRVGASLGEGIGDELRFNPWNTGGGIVPEGPLQVLRRSAYVASQTGRPA